MLCTACNSVQPRENRRKVRYKADFHQMAPSKMDLLQCLEGKHGVQIFWKDVVASGKFFKQSVTDLSLKIFVNFAWEKLTNYLGPFYVFLKSHQMWPLDCLL